MELILIIDLCIRTIVMIFGIPHTIEIIEDKDYHAKYRPWVITTSVVLFWLLFFSTFYISPLLDLTDVQIVFTTQDGDTFQSEPITVPSIALHSYNFTYLDEDMNIMTHSINDSTYPSEVIYINDYNVQSSESLTIQAVCTIEGTNDYYTAYYGDESECNKGYPTIDIYKDNV